MLRVKTFLKQSKVHGIGLFADEFIAKGTITWKYDPGFDPDFSKEEINNLTELHKASFLKYGYLDYNLDRFILCADDQRFINHSSLNNNISSTAEFDLAARDIKKGEELLCNYNDYEKDWFTKRGLNEDDFVN